LDSTLDQSFGLAVALGIGLLIGIERERKKGRSAAGIRTFALVAVLGGVTSLLGNVALFIGGAFIVVAAIASYFRTSGQQDPGLTTETALVVTFFLGALATENQALAAALGVLTAGLLVSRSALHHFVRDILTEDELHDLLLFAAAAVVVWPLLPDETVGPFGVVNPFHIWRLVVLVMAASGAGYLGLRTLGPRLGLPLAGLAGGFVSSVATIGSMGQRAEHQPEVRGAAVAGAILSTVATFIQLAFVLALTSRTTLGHLAIPLAMGGTAASLWGVTAALRSRTRTATDESAASRAFGLRGTLLFAATVSCVLFISAAANQWFGSRGVALTAVLAGFADAHSAAASVAALVASGRLSPSAAVLPILLALTSNAITKAVFSFAGGGSWFASPVIVGLVLAIGATWLGAALPVRF